ncbi:MAG: hypothetical protein SNJ77_08755 [Cytophagales bacterium]
MNEFLKKINLDDYFAGLPNCKSDFLDFVFENFPEFDNKNLNRLPFACLLGFFWAYFKSQGLDLDLNNLEPDETINYIQNELVQHEKTIAHFS